MGKNHGRGASMIYDNSEVFHKKKAAIEQIIDKNIRYLS